MSGLASVFPPPPPYYTSYTEEAVNKLEVWLNKSDADGDEPPESIIDLLPPSPPKAPQYRGFGEIWNTHESILALEDAGVTRLYKDLGENNEHLPAELKKLLRSALVCFVSLVGAISQNPESFPPIIENMRTILINAHHLLNLYRPHQSREALSLLLNKQIKTESALVAELTESNALIEEKMKSLVSRLPVQPNFVPDQADEHDFGEWLQFDLQATELWNQRRRYSLADVREESRESSCNPSEVPSVAASEDEPME